MDCEEGKNVKGQQLKQKQKTRKAGLACGNLSQVTANKFYPTQLVILSENSVYFTVVQKKSCNATSLFKKLILVILHNHLHHIFCVCIFTTAFSCKAKPWS